MPKRVSLKGKGADIFFGDFTPTSPESPAADSAASPTPTAGQVAAEPATAPTPVASSERSVRPRTHARTQTTSSDSDADSSARVRLAMKEALHRKLQLKQRLASYTFRFRPEELDQLEQILAGLERGNGQKPSKNDVIRLALLWLLADYEEHRDASILAQVLARS